MDYISLHVTDFIFQSFFPAIGRTVVGFEVKHLKQKTKVFHSIVHQDHYQQKIKPERFELRIAFISMFHPDIRQQITIHIIILYKFVSILENTSKMSQFLQIKMPFITPILRHIFGICFDHARGSY